MLTLSGKAVVITGSGRGLGAAYARHVAALGAAVVVNDIDQDAAVATTEDILSRGGKAVSCPGDVSLRETNVALVERCVERFGTITGFVCNAGLLRTGLLDQADERDLRLMLEVNVVSTAAGVQEAFRRMTKLGTGGSIITVTSGSQAGDIGLGFYAATKGAIASLTYSWAMEMRGSGVRLNAIAPLAETDMARLNAPLMPLQSAGRDVKYGILPAPEDNAPVVSFLLSDEAEGIHGQVVKMSGRQLSYLTHPVIAEPVLTDDWTLEKVQDAFRLHLARSQRKLGLAFEGKDIEGER